MKTQIKLKINSKKLKKYKTYKRKYNKRKLNTLKGGAAAVALPAPPALPALPALPAAANEIPSIIGLINNDNIVNVIINYNNLVLKCRFGKKHVYIGEHPHNCIHIIYKDTFSNLDSFFFNVLKTDCIGKNKTINNSKYRTQFESKSGILQEDYNKQLHETLFNLIDIININANMQFCVLSDLSIKTTTQCDEIQLCLLKPIEKGYGFYNEFGYIYKYNYLRNKQNIKYDNYDKYIIESNEILKITIPELRNKTLLDFQSYVFSLNPKTNIPKNIIPEQYNTKLLKDFVIDIMNSCKKKDEQLDFEQIIKDKNIISSQLESYINSMNMNHDFKESMEHSDFTGQFKLYDIKKQTISALKNKDDDEQRAFEMIPMKTHNIKISRRILDGFQYQIDII